MDSAQSAACQKGMKTKVSVYEGAVYVLDSKGMLLTIIDRGMRIEVESDATATPETTELSDEKQSYGDALYNQMKR